MAVNKWALILRATTLFSKYSVRFSTLLYTRSILLTFFFPLLLVQQANYLIPLRFFGVFGDSRVSTLLFDVFLVPLVTPSCVLKKAHHQLHALSYSLATSFWFRFSTLIILLVDLQYWSPRLNPATTNFRGANLVRNPLPKSGFSSINSMRMVIRLWFNNDRTQGYANRHLRMKFFWNGKRHHRKTIK